MQLESQEEKKGRDKKEYWNRDMIGNYWVLQIEEKKGIWNILMNFSIQNWSIIEKRVNWKRRVDNLSNSSLIGMCKK